MNRAVTHYENCWEDHHKCAKSEVERLLAALSDAGIALRKYGTHEVLCAGYKTGKPPAGHCTCGLDAAIEAAELDR